MINLVAHRSCFMPNISLLNDARHDLGRYLKIYLII